MNSFSPPGVNDARSPCPALNTLANHSYIPRSGTNITFIHLLRATKAIYNLSMPLALLLTISGFVTCGKLQWSSPFNSEGAWRWPISWTLSLANLAKRGRTKIAHEASLVHSSAVPTHAPHPALVQNLLSIAESEDGLSLLALAKIHASRVRALGHKLDGCHEQVAAGESALAWLVMHNAQTGAIEADKVESWFGEEKLPRGWWNGRRPQQIIGLLQARRTADEFEHLVNCEVSC
ncbi:Chloroperoxidase [Mycena amicta]|nr:Chloroperoxidase [Mycena amicta]